MNGQRTPEGATFRAIERAALHPIVCSRIAPDFFSGGLLGNGGMGVVVTTRPDAVVLYFGHNGVWDQRIAELDPARVGTFEDVFRRLRELPADLDSLVEDEWYREYCLMLKEPYNKPYPRPMPCGSVVLGFDRRKAEIVGHTVDIARGTCEVGFLVGGEPATLRLFAEPTDDRLWLSFEGADGLPAAAPFNRVRLMPDPSTPSDIPAAERTVDPAAGTLSFRQTLPYSEAAGVRHGKDKAFRLTVTLSDALEPLRVNNMTRNGIVATHLDDYMDKDGGDRLERALRPAGVFLAAVELEHGWDRDVSSAAKPARGKAAAEAGDNGLGEQALQDARERTREAYESFWSRSGVKLDDEALERTWYRNLYFFQCGVREGVTCPGLFANWLHDRIGSAWHGDYHLDYNTQQPFWLAFSANHAERHLPYVEMVHHITPVSRKWAEEYYGLPGAFYPVSAYPVDMTINPNAGPPFGWVMCTTPWVVQSLWWHYLYTMDLSFLRHRGFEPIRLAAQFMAAYMRRPDARRENDGVYRIFPTVPPELYGLTPGLALNADSLTDITLFRFVFRAYLQACEALDVVEAEADLMAEVADALAHMPEHPTAETADGGRVFVSVPDENPEMVYNTPNSAFTVFPGEEHGLHSPPELYELACRSYLNHRNEGGNELVFYHLQGARLGILDLEKFKRQIEYCLMPNGACTDMVLQTGGRYEDSLRFDFMSRMGVWFENTALPVVINECLLQSYNGVLRLFPNWPAGRSAEFRTLRAVGGFLVSAERRDGRTEWVEVLSEAGGRLRMYAPWPEGAMCSRGGAAATAIDGEIGLDTAPGETLRFVRLRHTEEKQ
ncbi:glycosyl hydrolase family 95 catalytic domain-containing protein [Cohnella cellulosilytica]|uniref:Glycosyl hydrolase family 95 catalytic domain-containing protein n=1 Tax=Cohnella cellulosilytica TaxID=986710 RepID=A0ABW2FNL9_9BACL